MAVVKEVQFTNRSGARIAARLNLPNGQMRAVALFAHCFTCSKDILAAVRIAQGLAEEGIATLRFDFTGLGQSGGDFASAGFASNLQDLEDAISWLKEELRAPDILIGHSLGGAAVLALVPTLDDIKGVVTIGAPAKAAHVLHLFSEAAFAGKDRVEVNIGGRPFMVEASFVEDLKTRTDLDHISRLRADLLILHAPGDEIVGIENAAEIFTAAKHPKSFVSLDKADHLLSRKQDAHFAASIIAAWAGRLCDDKQTMPKADEGEVVVQSSPDGVFAHNIAAGLHMMRADEPATIKGGLASGPAPYDFLLAGLGACTAMTLRLYAAHKKWPLEAVNVRLTHEKQHGQDLQDGKQDKMLDKMHREITLAGPLDEVQISRLLEIADKCPVHKSLEAGIAVSTSLTPR